MRGMGMVMGVRGRRNSVLRGFVLAGIVAGVAALPVLGQGLSLGIQGTASQNANWGFGPRLIADLGPLDFGFRLMGTFDYFFPDAQTFERAGVPVMAEDVDYWEANFNVAYGLGIPIITPYIGGGLNIAHTKVEGSPDGTLDVDETETGINVLAGVEIGLLGVKPFLEGRKSFGGGDQWMVTLGLMF